MSSYAIGIDTGGTYTDAVVVDVAGHRILAKAKALTTRGDLAIGVADTLDAVLAVTGRDKAIAVAALPIALSPMLPIEKFSV
jgi:N-methylhydantoinase A/oxoprolinase/acetone carboxylase beta subunit